MTLHGTVGHTMEYFPANAMHICTRLRGFPFLGCVSTDPVSLPCEGLLRGFKEVVAQHQTIKDPLVQRGLPRSGWGIVSAIIFDYLQIGSTLGQSLRLA